MKQLPQTQFAAFSSPQSNEDLALSSALWSLPNLSKLSLPSALASRFDVVHLKTATSKSLGLTRWWKSRGSKILFTMSIDYDSSDWNSRHFDAALKLADAITALSASTSKSLIARGFDVASITPNGVDFDFFSPNQAQPRLLQRLGVPQRFLFFSGYIISRKRPDVVIELARRLPFLNFVIAGVPPDNSDYGRRVLDAAARLSNVFMLGWVSKIELVALLASADALLFPSEREGSPSAALEALAMGTRVIAQPRSSMPEIILPGTNGYLIDVDEPNQWIDAVTEVSERTTSERDADRTRIRKNAMQNHSWEAAAARYRDIYSHLLGAQ